MTGHGHETPGPDGRFDGAQIPDQPFAHDDGTTPPDVAAALGQYRVTGDPAPVVVSLLPSRLLVALVAVLDSVDGAGAEKDSHMAAAMIERPDGRKALLAFTSVDGITRWHQDARPLPVTAVDAARAAIEDGADTLLVDGSAAITGAYLWALAEGRAPEPPIDQAQVLAAIAAAVEDVLGGAALPTTYEVADGGEDADVLVLLDPAVAAHRPVVGRLAEVLAADPVLRSRLPRGLALGIDTVGVHADPH